MELLESQDPEKRRLIETSERHKRELEREVTAISDQTEKVVKNALIIGGALALTYLLVNQITAPGKKKKKTKTKTREKEVEEDDADDEEATYTEPSILSQLGTRVVNTATVMLLDLAKEKLTEYLETRNRKDEDS
jgi:hypothetical protein